MNNKKALEFFTKLIEKDSSAGVEKYGHDTTNIDAEFLTKYLDKSMNILDIGSGTGLIINKIYKLVNHIDAIEPFKEFSDHIIKDENIRIFNSNFLEFKSNEKYDLISLFGFMHYFNATEAREIYEKCFSILKDNSFLIVKNQFGVIDDVTVSGFSEELKSNYFAQYRSIENEVKLLHSLGFKNTEVIDIYPPECNRWDNTHFYAIIAQK